MSSAEVVLLWLGTYAVHSSIILGTVALLDRRARSLTTERRIGFWRFGLAAALVTASLQTGGVLESQTGRWAILSVTPSTVQTMPQTGTAANTPAGEQAAVASESPAAALSEPPAAALSASTQTDVSASAGTENQNSSRRTANTFTAKGIDWSLLLLAALLLGGLVNFLRLATRAVTAHRQLADRSAVNAGPLHERLHAVAAAAGVTAPRLSVSQRIAGPITLPSCEICVPADVPESLAPDMLDALLAHELAHSLRRDALWLNAALVIEAVLFWQPLNRMARRRLVSLAEIAADNWAVRWTGQPHALVECLVEFAERARFSPPGEFAAAMARDDATLLERSRRLLERDGGGEQEPALSPAAKWIFVAALVALALALPQLISRNESGAVDTAAQSSDASANSASHVAAEPASAFGFTELPDRDYEPGPAAFSATNGNSLSLAGGVTVISGNKGSTSVSVNGRQLNIGGSGNSRIVINGNSINVSGSRGGSVTVNGSGSGTSIGSISGEQMVLSRDQNFVLLSEGEIVLRPDGTGIEAIPPGGIVDLALLEGRERHRFRLERDGDVIARAWWVNDERRPWDSDADAAFAELLPVVMRATTLGARERVAWLRESGGNRAVLDEIERLKADSVQAGYARIFVDQFGGDLPDADFERVLDIVGKGITRDPQLSNLLEDLASQVSDSDTRARTWLAASARISSEVHRANALEALALRARLRPESWIALLEAASDIGSDVHQANLLADIADRVPRDEATNAAFLRSVNTIGSSVHRGRALDAFF